jgi:hypothetical protein
MMTDLREVRSRYLAAEGGGSDFSLPRVVFVGGGHPSGGKPFEGDAGKKLSEYAGVDLLPLRGASVDFINLYARFPTKWRKEAAKKRAAGVLSDVVGANVVVLCGRRVCEAFGLDPHPYLKDRGRGVVTMPHPLEGYWWSSNAGNVKKMRVFFEGLDVLAPMRAISGLLPGVLASWSSDVGGYGWYPYPDVESARSDIQEFHEQAVFDELAGVYMPNCLPDDPFRVADPDPIGFVRFLRSDIEEYGFDPLNPYSSLTVTPDGGFPADCGANVRRVSLFPDLGDLLDAED